MGKKIILTVAAVCAAFNLALAEISMPKIFSDDMVLQSGKPVKFWGKAAPGAKVEIVMEKLSAKTSADSDGNWEVYMDPLEPTKAERSLHVFENGHIQKSINGVLVGEVWICSGQSNMEWRAANTTTLADIKKFAATNPPIRYFSQNSAPIKKTPQEDSPEGAKWIRCAEDTVANFSAVGIYFAEDIYKSLDVPVGLIYAARGATAMCCWLPKEDHAGTEGFRRELARYNIGAQDYDMQKATIEWEKRMADLKARQAKAKAEGKPIPTLPWNQMTKPTEMGTNPTNYPYGHYNKMLHPIRGYTAQGVLWYQGESDTGGDRAKFYAENLEYFIKNWRRIWNDKNLAFYMVQLASFTAGGNNNGWCGVQNAQFAMSRKMKNVKTAPSIDCGEEKDIHPKEKSIPAKRLAKMALKDIYKKDIACAEIPYIKCAKICRNKAEISFESYGAEVVCKGQPRGFEIKCFGQWIQPKAEFKDGKILLSSPNGQNIQAVRYLWRAWCMPDICLFSNGKPIPNFNSELN